ncbi:ParB/RepB/Spo0J family partition protein [Kitasatospora sp. NBC_01266]|uniref:ParB/RepB/Spo0J family partition protein n=1 Tax=Kitasatospora sp. NBC_01266 TaxID=2903572 RepID=UPI002E343F6E|nr:hypothetical protein [Kitasatospora sp. NBC_01266]
MTSGIDETAAQSLRTGAAHGNSAGTGASADLGRLPLAALCPGDSPRFTPLDEAHAAHLAALDAELPPILVHRPTLRVVDGAHRLRAAALRGEPTIAVEYVDGTPEAAFVRAVAANLTGGLPLSVAERKTATERIVRSRPEQSDRSIAQHVGLSAKTVGEIRRRCCTGAAVQSSIRVGRDGRLRPVNPDEGRRRVLKVISERPGASLREIAQAAGVSLGTAHGVRSRVDRGVPVVPAAAPALPGPSAPSEAAAPACRPAPARTAPARTPSPSSPSHTPSRTPAPARAAVRPQPRPVTPPVPPVPRVSPDRPEPVRHLAQRRLPGGYSGGKLPAPTTTAAARSSFARLAVLRRDPSLRFTDRGRALLVWLHRRLIAVSAAERELQDIPPHLLPVVADLALECAEGWRELADQLRGRARQTG